MRIGSGLLEINAVMDHADLSAPVFWKAAGLEMGRADVPVSLLQCEVEIGVFHGELRLLLPPTIVLEFRIEVGVEAEFIIEKLLVTK